MLRLFSNFTGIQRLAGVFAADRTNRESGSAFGFGRNQSASLWIISPARCRGDFWLSGAADLCGVNVRRIQVDVGDGALAALIIHQQQFLAAAKHISESAFDFKFLARRTGTP